MTSGRMLAGVALIGVIFVTPACKKKGGSSPRGAQRFSLGPLDAGWRSMDPLGADKAWYHPARSATIYADANCGARYEDGQLDALLTHLTFGIARGAPLRDEPLMLDGRSALVRSFNGQLDGVAVQVGAMVTKKNDCLYDVLYIAPPARFDEGWSDFVGAIQGFTVGR